MDEINLNDLMTLLGDEKIDSVFIEGGAYTHGKALESGIAETMHVLHQNLLVVKMH